MNIDSLTKSEGLLNDPLMFNAFSTMRQRVKDLKGKMNEKDWTIFHGKLVIE